MNNKDRRNLLEVPMPRIAGLDLATEMAHRPYAVLGFGVLTGYVLGGGVFTRLTARALSTGLRVIGLPLLTRAAVKLFQSKAGSAPLTSGATPDPTP